MLGAEEDVVGIDTSAHVTLVAAEKSIWDCTAQALVKISMRLDAPAVAIAPLPYRHNSISLPFNFTLVYPAVIIIDYVSTQKRRCIIAVVAHFAVLSRLRLGLGRVPTLAQPA